MFFKRRAVPFFFPFLHLAFWNVDTMVGVPIVIMDQEITQGMEAHMTRNEIKCLALLHQEVSMAASDECFWASLQDSKL